ncbi:MAG: hypothetical protein ACFFG0_19695 [Candidatus Thorarchaeota archaeon]
MKKLILDGKFGPGTKKIVSLDNKNWKAIVGAIENKRRPEAMYALVSTWIKPQLSILKAMGDEGLTPEALVDEVAEYFVKELKQASRKFSTFFDPTFFDIKSLIFKYDYAHTRAQVGKPQFLELDLNIWTVNDIDDNGNPIPYKGTGKLEQLHFDQFVAPMRKAVNKLLMMDVFSNSTLMTFHKTKSG